MTAYRFFPWVRRGVAAAVERPDPLGTAALPGRVPVTLALSVEGTAVPDGGRPVHLYGPGDVAALDPAQVVRAYPAPGATDAEPNYFAAVELDRPDLPWLLTPASPHAGAATVGDSAVPETENARLRPWICLAVVPRALEGVTLRAEAGKPLPVLRVPSAVQLPDLAESHLWAHAQAFMSEDETLARVDDEHPERTLSRLVCPRKLEPRTAYFAAVVPTWDAGRLAGLGLPPADAASFGPAWSGTGPVELPVYYHWEFTTGEPGDFEALVERIQPGALRAAEGLSLDARAPGSQLPSAGVLEMDGALRGVDTPPRGRPEDVPAGFQSAVAARIAAARTAGDGTAPLAPPLYGGAPVLRDTVDASAPAWLRALNLDPRHRAAAGLGARVVRRYQEQLVDAAWEQAGELRRANQALRQGQLAREVGGRLLKRWIQPLPAERLLAVSEPVHARLALPADAQRTGEGTAAAAALTVRAQVKGSALPDEAVSPASRRVLRPGGPLAKRAAATRSLASDKPALDAGLDLKGGGGALDGILRKLSQGGYSQPQGGGGVVLGDPTGMLPPENVAPRPAFALAPTGAPAPATGGDGAADNAVAAAFRAAAKQTQGAFVKARRVAAEAAAPPPALPLEQVRDAIVGGLDPAPAVAARVLSRVRVGDASASAALASTSAGTGDALAGLGLTPSFHVPAYGLLAELSTHLLLPGGAEAMPPETAALVRTNPAFVAAFMAGLNHEVQRELLWREFPSDPRGTPFRRFWDTRGTAGGAPDVPAMTSWGESRLEDVVAGPAPDGDGDGDGQLVLLIRGELLRRYPGAVFYAVPGAWTQAEDGTPRRAPDPDATRHRMPRFRGTLGADVQLIGFALDPDDARGSADPADGAAGWFFVIEQQPTEPRFGLDAQATPGGAPGWSELAWADVTPTPAGYLPVGAAGSRTVPAGGPVWGATAAHMAHITLRRPVRVAVHADAMLPD